MSAGADVHAEDQHGRTALLYAAQNNSPKCARQLLKYGASLDDIDTMGQNALIVAAKASAGNVIDVLIEGKISLEQTDHKGNTALSWAIFNGHVSVVNKLLQCGADVNQENMAHMHPLMLSVLGDADSAVTMVKHLLSAGASVDATNELGNTALIMATYENNIDMVQLLIEEGANILRGVFL